jgi:hypothetical protein
MKRLRMWICDFISLEGEDEGESDNEYLIDCEQDEDDISSIIIVSCETIKKKYLFWLFINLAEAEPIVV